MSTKAILLKFLPGLVPLIVFIIIDEFFGTRIGIVVAIGIGVIQSIYIWFKDKRIDKFILFDTLLIVGLGLVSVLLDSDVFFKLKPAIIGILITLLIGVSAFGPRNLLWSMSKRYMGKVEFTETQYKQFQSSLKALFFFFLLHTGLVFYSVWFLSDEAWAFISGGLFYIMFGAYFVVEFLRKKFKFSFQRKEEILPIVDADGKLIGKASRTECHQNKSLLHPVVHLHLINNNGDLFLQKRAKNKHIQPGKWDTSVGGHVSFGETIEQALIKEAKEELGIVNFSPIFISKYIWESEIEKELVFSFFAKYDDNFDLNNKELERGKYWTKKDIDLGLNSDIFTPNFKFEYSKLIKPVLIKIRS